MGATEGVGYVQEPKMSPLGVSMRDIKDPKNPSPAERESARTGSVDAPTDSSGRKIAIFNPDFDIMPSTDFLNLERNDIMVRGDQTVEINDPSKYIGEDDISGQFYQTGFTQLDPKEKEQYLSNLMGELNKTETTDMVAGLLIGGALKEGRISEQDAAGLIEAYEPGKAANILRSITNFPKGYTMSGGILNKIADKDIAKAVSIVEKMKDQDPDKKDVMGLKAGLTLYKMPDQDKARAIIGGLADKEYARNIEKMMDAERYGPYKLTE